MNMLSKFVPDTFNSLKIDEKKQAIINLINEICELLKLDKIDVDFCDLRTNDDKVVVAFFNYLPLSIYINNSFLENDSKYFNKSINMNIYLPYLLVHAVAHDCFHYYQNDMIMKLVNGCNEPDFDKNQAYLYFICLYQKLFSSFNDKEPFSDVPAIDKSDLYLYSPTEIEANNFGNKITELLSKNDIPNNYSYYQSINISNYLLSLNDEQAKGGGLTIKTIEHNLRLALDFLNYKNKKSGLKAKYLDIDPDDLEKGVKEILKEWKRIYNKRKEFYNKIKKK